MSQLTLAFESSDKTSQISAAEANNTEKAESVSAAAISNLPGLGVAQMVLQDNRAFMATLAPESMQLIVTSPPYNIGKDYETRAPLDAYLDSQRETIELAYILLRPGGSIC